MPQLLRNELTRILPQLVIIAQWALLVDCFLGLFCGLCELVARGVAARLLAGSLGWNIVLARTVAFRPDSRFMAVFLYLRQLSESSLMRLLNLLNESDTSPSENLVSLSPAVKRVSFFFFFFFFPT